MSQHRSDPNAARRAPGGVRTDIQGMRALAVVVVLVFHVLPERLTGGFVGVDVFFVISGFLITTHLMTHPPATARDFAGFWARRARRLLPASLLVLLVTLVATRLLAPETLWGDTARQAGGAATYVVNWLLASDAVDYLAADDAPTPVQHYWSLSVEEQFYLLWPVLIALAAWLARRPGGRAAAPGRHGNRRWSPAIPMTSARKRAERRHPGSGRELLGREVLGREVLRRHLLWGTSISLVALASFAWSVHLTRVDPGRAYFVTTTRVWELAVGGLAALLLLLRPARPGASTRVEALRAALAWLGLGAIVHASVTFDESTPFPGWRAAVPVLGAALVVVASCGTRTWSPGRLLAVRPVQWLGDVSYSVYLWHWPLVVLVGARTGGVGGWEAMGIVALTLVLAQLTKTWVEDPFRSRAWNVRLGLTYRLAGVGMAVVLGAAAVQHWEVERRAEAETARVAAQLAAAGPCLGAGALAPGADCEEEHEEPIVPSPAQAATDKSDAYPEVSGGADCWSSMPDYPSVECTFGEEDARTEVVLVGNSHAGHWLPAVQEIAEARGWRITTLLASQCALVDTRLQLSSHDRSESCRAWGERAVERMVDLGPDLVLMSNRISVPAEGQSLEDSVDDYTQGYVPVLTRLADAGVPVAVIRDTPAPGDGGEITSIPDCLAAEGEHSEACDGTRSDWVRPDPDPAIPAVRAVQEARPRAALAAVDLNDHICDGEVCPAVVGGVVVYFDGTHLTATYARTLGTPLDRALVTAGLVPPG